MSDTLIDLIRHGEPAGGRRIRGNGCDDPLSPFGWEQMWRAVDGQHPWGAIWSSPMRRCRDFAEALGQRLGLDVTLDQRLREVGFGTWEGRTLEEIRVTEPSAYAAFREDPVRHRPAGAEDLYAFAGRVDAALGDALIAHREGHMLVVAHAGVIRAAVGLALDAPAQRWYRLRVDHAGISRFRHDGEGMVLELHNARAL
jgi:alpha-ribazole phosphatase